VTADGGRGSLPSDGSWDDIERLVLEMSNRLFAIAFRILGHRADAEDAVQNAWIKAIRRWRRASSLPTREAQCALMVRVVINEARQLNRRRYRKREFPGIDGVNGEEGPHASEDDEERLQAKDRLRLAWQAIGELPPGRREVVVLYTAGYEYGEIAEMLGIRVSTVGSHMSNARKYLRGAVPDAREGEPE
jgi:RNA polymerase sigma-70 factor (ECF subfamily)